jgi:DNA-binding NtrC family response regulator
LTHVDSADAAGRLGNERDFLVGLVVFPKSRDRSAQALREQTVFALPRVKWVGALPRENLSDIVTKRFIAERLYDFQVFPLDGERLMMALGHAYGMASLEREFQRTLETGRPVRSGFVGDSPAMQDFFRVLQHASEADVPVLITGPTGTGKEKAARAIHDQSVRAQGPFVAINCAAIPPSLLQAELFGHSKGAFTGAFQRKIGHIESASGGTLFLDEIGDMPVESQATLLRFLEDKTVTPLGTVRGKAVDVRVIASTNRDLEAAIRDRDFRADLFYRLAVLVVRTPSLSDRGGDIDLLAHYFLDEAMAAVGRTSDLSFTKNALKAMRLYAWPGNLRELRSAVLGAVLQCRGRYVHAEDLNLGDVSNQTSRRFGADRDSLQDARNQTDKASLELSLALNGSNITRTANDLKVSRMTLYRLMAKHGVSRTAGT